MQNAFDVAIIGGGAAGMMCAAVAGRRGRSVVVIERGESIGKKIRISGGGRCNFTNLYTSPDNFISNNPHFCKSALARYSQHDFIALVEQHRIAYHEKKLGQLFCDDSAQQIIDMLLGEAADAGASVVTRCGVRSVLKEGGFILETSLGTIEAESLVIATGGLSIPTLGATDFGYRIARQFGLPIVPTAPALVPLTFTIEDLHRFGDIAGVSADALVGCRLAEFRENILFTHRGLSGPAILQISSYRRDGESISLNLFPQLSLEELFGVNRTSKAYLHNILGEIIPGRLAMKLCEEFTGSRPMNSYSNRELAELALRLHNIPLNPDGTEGYAKAEVTRGGVDTGYLSSKTMESKTVMGLYFIGEVLDVTGQLGGHNFQWAWSSSSAAGEHA